jgi:hypothetical protein
MPPHGDSKTQKGNRTGPTDVPLPIPIDPRVFGFVKAAYSVDETLDVLSIGRTSLYAAVKRGDLHPVKFGKKTLFLAVNLAAFLVKLRQADNPPSRVPTARARHVSDQAS